MTNINAEISRLTNKDVKIRRRAVRALFEEDDASALRGFVKLLDDSDFWFRNKALDAHRKWAKSPEELEPLMANNKQVVAELLQKIPAPEIAKSLLEEEDNVIRSFAAKSLSKSTDLHSRFAKDEHHSVRIVAAENSEDLELLSSLISDKHAAVRRAAISTASSNQMDLGEDTLKIGLDSNDPALRSLVASLAVKYGGDIFEMACKDNDPKVRKSIADTLRTDVDKVDSRIETAADICPEIIVRWLRSKYDKDASLLRWSMIENTSLNSRLRSKLIEQMEGRDDTDQERLAAILEDSSNLVKIAAQNLSQSIQELEG